ncbi:ER membrane protein complex subunit 2-like [Hylaeus volcanicus]|uniref:ER membrane protein complex subunit 2-like n=1 Tax=Hylaeus volcanicus TaxID=313075 RepID=UPI0023B784F9|nr:ER membrane protein complex subunit 2-like [Hylaeus volcanicus]
MGLGYFSKCILNQNDSHLKSTGHGINDFLVTSLTGNIEIAIKEGLELIEKDQQEKGYLGFNKWRVYERIAHLTAIVGLNDWSHFCLKALETQFPASNRVALLKLTIECLREKKPETLETFINVVEKNKTDFVLRKQAIMYYFSMNHNASSTINLLLEHLLEFSQDVDAWILLAQLYIYQSCYPQAIFCYEEALLNNATNILTSLTVAELSVSIKQYDNGLRYYFIALQQQPDQIRGLWGVVWTIHTLLNDPSYSKNVSKKQKSHLQEAQACCVKTLKHLYQVQLLTQFNDRCEKWNHVCLDVLCDISN